MKVNFKRVATAALAVAMSLSLSVPAFAEGNSGDRTLTVTGDTLDNKDVYAVQMFTARATGTDSVVFDNYELADENWLDFFHAASAAGGLDMTGADADAAREYVEKLTGDNLVTFADKAQAWVRGHAGGFEVITSDSEDPAVADKATFTKLKAGYYLVYPEGGSTGTENRGTDAMLVNVPRDNNAEWNIKSTFPTVDKTVEDNNDNTTGDGANGSAQVGDTVTFTLTSAVPDMSDYTTFYFAFNDTMSKGLEFVQKQSEPATVDANDVTVTIGGAPVATTYYTASLTDNKLKVEFTNLKNVSGATTGATITVTYQAKITEEAVSAGDSILGTAENEANVEYSNDPNGTGHGTSTPDKSKVYTYDIKIEKYWVDAASGGVEVDGSWDGNHDMELESLSLDTNEKYLAGATFVLSNSQETPTKTGEPAAYGPEVVRLTGSVDTGLMVDPDGAVTEFTTKNAPIIIEGLEAGTYYLHEIDAPDGFNKLKEPVEIQIVVEPLVDNDATDDATLDKPVYIIDGEVNAVEDNAVKVENKQGIELPETGSIGTIGLTALGVVVVVAGLFAFPRKKKTRQD